MILDLTNTVLSWCGAQKDFLCIVEICERSSQHSLIAAARAEGRLRRLLFEEVLGQPSPTAKATATAFTSRTRSHGEKLVY